MSIIGAGIIGGGSGGGSANTNYKGWFTTQLALTTAYPVGQNGWYAIVGSTDTVWTWDSDTTAWKNTNVGSLVTSVNTQIGDVVLNQDHVLDGTTYKQYSNTEKTKLAGIENNATANSTNSFLLDRTNHTGTQLASTISDLQTNVSGNTDVSANTSARHTHSNKVILDGTQESFTSVLKTKLDSIESGAEVNVQADYTETNNLLDSYIRNKPNLAPSATTDTTTTQNITDFTDKRFVTDAKLAVLQNTSNTNTGDQNLSGLVVKANNGNDFTNIQTTINNLTSVVSATNEHVLTKDTATGNAIFKVLPSVNTIYAFINRHGSNFSDEYGGANPITTGQNSVLTVITSINQLTFTSAHGTSNVLTIETNQIRITQTGYYEILCDLVAGGNAGVNFFAQVIKNGNTILTISRFTLMNGGGLNSPSGLSMHFIGTLNANDFIDVRVNGVNLSTATYIKDLNLSVKKI